MNLNGDTSLSIPKCKNICYRRVCIFAGAQEGNQCWCSNNVSGEWAKNQTDCNITCTGDKVELCDGKRVVNVFEALKNGVLVVSSNAKVAATSTGIQSTTVSTGVQAAATSPSSGYTFDSTFSYISGHLHVFIRIMM